MVRASIAAGRFEVATHLLVTSALLPGPGPGFHPRAQNAETFLSGSGQTAALTPDGFRRLGTASYDTSVARAAFPLLRAALISTVTTPHAVVSEVPLAPSGGSVSSTYGHAPSDQAWFTADPGEPARTGQMDLTITAPSGLAFTAGDFWSYVYRLLVVTASSTPGAVSGATFALERWPWHQGSGRPGSSAPDDEFPSGEAEEDRAFTLSRARGALLLTALLPRETSPVPASVPYAPEVYPLSVAGPVVAVPGVSGRAFDGQAPSGFSSEVEVGRLWWTTSSFGAPTGPDAARGLWSWVRMSGAQVEPQPMTGLPEDARLRAVACSRPFAGGASVVFVAVDGDDAGGSGADVGGLWVQLSTDRDGSSGALLHGGSGGLPVGHDACMQVVVEAVSATEDVVYAFFRGGLLTFTLDLSGPTPSGPAVAALATSEALPAGSTPQAGYNITGASLAGIQTCPADTLSPARSGPSAERGVFFVSGTPGTGFRLNRVIPGGTATFYSFGSAETGALGGLTGVPSEPVSLRVFAPDPADPGPPVLWVSFACEDGEICVCALDLSSWGSATLGVLESFLRSEVFPGGPAGAAGVRLDVGVDGALLAASTWGAVNTLDGLGDSSAGPSWGTPVALSAGTEDLFVSLGAPARVDDTGLVMGPFGRAFGVYARPVCWQWNQAYAEAQEGSAAAARASETGWYRRRPDAGGSAATGKALATGLDHGLVMGLSVTGVETGSGPQLALGETFTAGVSPGIVKTPAARVDVDVQTYLVPSEEVVSEGPIAAADWTSRAAQALVAPASVASTTVVVDDAAARASAVAQRSRSTRSSLSKGAGDAYAVALDLGATVVAARLAFIFARDSFPDPNTIYHLYSGTPGSWTLRATATPLSDARPDWSFQLGAHRGAPAASLAAPFGVFVDVWSLGANQRFEGGTLTNDAARAWMLVETGSETGARQLWSAYAYDDQNRFIGAPARFLRASDADFSGLDARRLERVLGTRNLTITALSGGLYATVASSVSEVAAGDLVVIDLTQPGGPGPREDGSTTFEALISGASGTTLSFAPPGLPVSFSGLDASVRRISDITASAPSGDDDIFVCPITGSLEFSAGAVARGLTFEVERYVKLAR